MKTKILSFGIFFSLIYFGINKLEGQEKTQIIEYNFSTGEFEKANIKPIQMIPTVFKIKNINPVFYKITVESSNKIISYENSDIQEIKDAAKKLTKSSESFVPEKLSISTNFFSVFDKTNIEKNKNLKNLFNKKLMLESKLQGFTNQLQESNDENLVKKNLFEAAQIQNELRLLNIDIEKDLDREDKIQFYLYETKNNINKINESYNKLIASAYEIQNIVTNYNNFIDKITIPDLTFDKFKDLKKCANDENCFGQTTILKDGKITDFYSENRYFQTLFKEFLKSYNDYELKDNLYQLKASSKEYSTLVDNILAELDKMKNSATETNDKIVNFNLSGKLNNVEVLVDKLSNQCNYEYVSAPIQGTEDYLEFDVTVENRYMNTEKYTFNSEKSFKHFEYLKKGIRFDFSVGTVFDFINKDKEYEIQNNIIKQTSNNKFTPVLAGIFHASFRETGNVAWGFSLGGALDVTNFNINSVFPGVSLLLGKKDKVVFTIGPSFKKIKELKSNYEVDKSAGNETDIENLKTNNFKVGMFFGISYNLTNRQKDLIKISNQ